eukprot:3535546-Alexandrium_andersonii.AAC.1
MEVALPSPGVRRFDTFGPLIEMDIGPSGLSGALRGSLELSGALRRSPALSGALRSSLRSSPELSGAPWSRGGVELHVQGAQ